MLTLREYQSASIDALYSYFTTQTGNPLLAIPTGGGKSLVIAEFVRGALKVYPETRILILTHVRELIAQNFSELLNLWPDAPAGIYSAGLNQRNLSARILFAGIQSIHKKAYGLQHVDLVLVDEAHLIPRNADTMYGRLLRDLKSINPDLKVVGFTATPFRLDSGLLTEGPDRIFTDIAHDVRVADLIAQGFLSPLVGKATATRFDLSGVHRRGGEFVAGQLEAAVDQADVTRAAVSEIVALGADRRAWLCFCAGVRHAGNVRDALRDRGINAEMVSGETPGGERDAIVAAFRRGEIRALTNANVLTTGFNVPAVDLIALLRPTESAGLYVQMLGRGTRLAPGKANCLVLDFAENIERHGPFDEVRGKAKRGGGGEREAGPMAKTCPVCDVKVGLAVRECSCGHIWPAPAPAIAPVATNLSPMSSLEPDWLSVDEIEAGPHRKAGSPTSLRIAYRCGVSWHREWVCFEHSGYARQKAVAWWTRRSETPPPDTVDEALSRLAELRRTDRIAVRRNGKYTEIVAVEIGQEPMHAEDLRSLPAPGPGLLVASDDGAFDIGAGLFDEMS